MRLYDRPLFQNKNKAPRGDVRGYAIGGDVTGVPSGGVVSLLPSGTIARPLQKGFPLYPEGKTGDMRMDPRGMPVPDLYEPAFPSSAYLPGSIEAAKDAMDAAQKEAGANPTGENIEAFLRAKAYYDEAVKGTEYFNKQAQEEEANYQRDLNYPTHVEGPDAALAAMSPDQVDLFNARFRAAQNMKGPSGMETEARAPRPLVTPMKEAGMETEARASHPPVTPAGETGTKGLGPSDMEESARGRRPMAMTPADVASGLNSDKPEVREKTMADFMKEFTDAAPKYKGADKGLLLAQIGFAIAAGDSPNAMKNIADGLLMGSQEMIKDKAARDEFDRQLQLSAMQYGLGETSKIAAEKRAMEREGRNGTHYVATKKVTINGRTYEPGQSVFVPFSTLWDGGIPDGLQTEAMADAFASSQAAVKKAVIEAAKDRQLTPAEYMSTVEKLDGAAESFASARSLRPLVEASIQRAADGTVTGVSSVFTDWVNKAATAAGVDLGKQYENVEQYNKDLQKVGNRLIQELLRESGRTVSDMDRQRVADMIGQLNNSGILAGATTDPEVALSSLQDVLKVLDQSEQSALDTYTTIMRDMSGSLTPGGSDFTGTVGSSRTFGEQSNAPIDNVGLLQYNKKLGYYEFRGP